MALGNKAFVLLLPDDWRNMGLSEGLCPEEEGLTLLPNAGKGVFVSAKLDALEAGTLWHRLRLDADIPENAVLRICFYCSDLEDAALPDGDWGDLDSFLMDESRPIREKERFFLTCGAKTSENLTDLLLYDLKGRYLWFCLTLLRYGEEGPRLRKCRLEFPRISFLDYLPQVYRGADAANSFLDRLIGVFQSVYLELEEQMDQTPVLYDAERADPAFLHWLGQWLAVSDGFLWEESRLRAFLKNAVRLYRRKGTLPALREAVALYTGCAPMIIEQFAAAAAPHWERDREVFSRLYGADSRTFTVLLPAKELGPETYPKLLKVIDRFRPVDAVCRLVFYEDVMRLGSHCYLGINSVIGGSRRFILDHGGTEAGAPYLEGSARKAVR